MKIGANIRMKEKYIVRCWHGYQRLIEKRTNRLLEAIRIKKELQREEPESYCEIIKVPFRKRHPDFPLWFSIALLLLVGISPVVEWCIHHILQIMQLLK